MPLSAPPPSHRALQAASPSSSWLALPYSLGTSSFNSSALSLVALTDAVRPQPAAPAEATPPPPSSGPTQQAPPNPPNPGNAQGPVPAKPSRASPKHQGAALVGAAILVALALVLLASPFVFGRSVNTARYAPAFGEP